MDRIECTTLHGRHVLIEAENLILRAAAYAVVFKDDKVLLTQMKSTDKYYLPGGGSRLGEKLQAAVKREVKEETGIDIRVQTLLHFQEDFFYYDPFDEAYHSLLFYYRCSPLTFELLSNEQIYDQEACNPQWRCVDELEPEDFQNHGDVLLQLLNTCRNQELQFKENRKT